MTPRPTPLIIPVFLPHAGCPHQCIFCNQNTITGAPGRLPSPQAVRRIIETHLSYPRTGERTLQIAFFGGNFLELPRRTILAYLSLAQEYITGGEAAGIRFSTRPDTVDPARMALLKGYAVQTVELGVQSMDNAVLDAACRGHRAEDTTRAFFVAKRVRTETGIGDHAVSISYAAIELGKKIFGSLEGKKALLIGAGEMAELAVEHLIRNRAGEIRVANRTFEHGMALANKFNGRAIRLEEVSDTLRKVDIIISSTGAREFVITRNQVKKIMRKRRNRLFFLIDIAVPRDIDPGINNLSNCYVYDIDDLKGVIEENIEERRQEAVKGERIVDEAVIRFQQWYRSLDVIPTIVALRRKLEAIAEMEVRKTLHALNGISDKDARAIHRMKEALVKKIMHDPTLFLKSDGCHGEKTTYLDFTQKLFNLDES